MEIQGFSYCAADLFKIKKMLTSKLIKFTTKCIFIILLFRIIYWSITTVIKHSNCSINCQNTMIHDSDYPIALFICSAIILLFFIVFVIKSNSGDYDKFYEKYTDPILKKIIKLLK